MHLSDHPFLGECRQFRADGFAFLALQSQEDIVSYTFIGDGAIRVLEQTVDEKAVRSIAHIFPLADFAERQMYRDCGIKSIGNINLVPPKEN